MILQAPVILPETSLASLALESWWFPFWDGTCSGANFAVTPLKINMEHNHGGLVQIIFLSKWVICRFQPLIFQGVVFGRGKPVLSWVILSLLIAWHIFFGFPKRTFEWVSWDFTCGPQ